MVLSRGGPKEAEWASCTLDWLEIMYAAPVVIQKKNATTVVVSDYVNWKPETIIYNEFI